MGEHTISELSALSGLPVRTIRYYRAQGLIPSAGREGPAARYPDSTLARLRLVAKLRDRHLPLAEIRRRLETLADETVSELATGPMTAEAPETSALDYIRALLIGEPKTIGDPATDLRAEPLLDPFQPSYLRRRPLAVREVGPIEVEAQVAQPMQLEAVVHSAGTSSAAGERSQWERIVLAPDIELHVRRPLSRRQNRMVERLIAFARQLQGEDRP